MTWFKVDDGFWSHPKVMGLSDSAVALWVKAGSYSARYLTDGCLNSSTIRPICNQNTHWRRLVQELVDSGLWEQVDGSTWRFHDWGSFQPESDEILEKRRANAERIRKWRERRKEDSNAVGNAVTNGVANNVSNDVSNASPDPTRPDPTNCIGVSPKEDSGKRAVGSRRSSKTLLPEGWHPNEHHVQTAGERGIDLATEAEKFKAYAESNAKRYANWDQAFNNWLLNASNFNRQQQGYVNKAQQRYEQNMQRIQAAEARAKEQPQLTQGGSDNDFGF